MVVVLVVTRPVAVAATLIACAVGRGAVMVVLLLSAQVALRAGPAVATLTAIAVPTAPRPAATAVRTLL